VVPIDPHNVDKMLVGLIGLAACEPQRMAVDEPQSPVQEDRSAVGQSCSLLSVHCLTGPSGKVAFVQLSLEQFKNHAVGNLCDCRVVPGTFVTQEGMGSVELVPLEIAVCVG